MAARLIGSAVQSFAGVIGAAALVLTPPADAQQHGGTLIAAFSADPPASTRCAVRAGCRTS